MKTFSQFLEQVRPSKEERKNLKLTYQLGQTKDPQSPPDQVKVAKQIKLKGV